MASVRALQSTLFSPPVSPGLSQTVFKKRCHNGIDKLEEKNFMPRGLNSCDKIKRNVFSPSVPYPSTLPSTFFFTVGNKNVFRFPVMNCISSSQGMVSGKLTSDEQFNDDGENNVDYVEDSEAIRRKEMEMDEEKKLFSLSFDEIAGIPRHEWSKLRKPARYLGNEFGSLHKDWKTSKIKFCLAYPEVYEVGASNLGHIVLYSILNEMKNVLCDRCYFIEDDLLNCLKKYNKLLFAVESRQPLKCFHTVGFSLSYELGATNILEMLSMSDIPLTWQERTESDDVAWDVTAGSFPLIFSGGPTATSNPEVFSDFFDFMALGDGEECLAEIAKCLEICVDLKLSRFETLLKLAQTVKGVYVPQFYETIPGWGGAVFPVVENIPSKVLRRVSMPDPFRQIALVPYVETVHDRMVIEIRRGCTRGCRFCQPGMLTRPARDVDPEKVVDAVEQGILKTGYNEFSLLSLSCSDYLSLPSVGIQIKNRLKDKSISLSLPSQRVDMFNDDIANIIGGTRKGSLTFAPEAGTQRMRDIINKGLTDEELLRGIKTAWDKGWRQAKLYFMIGLPGETDEDVIGIARTVKWLQYHCRRGKIRMSFRLTVSNFTPKPHTPFQWHSVSTEEFERKQKLLKKEFKFMMGVKCNYTDTRLSAMEDFIGRGDRSIGKVIRRAWELGTKNDSWWGNLDDCFHSWSQAIDESGLTWKYRQVQSGEWNVMENLGNENFRGQRKRSLNDNLNDHINDNDNDKKYIIANANDNINVNDNDNENENENEYEKMGKVKGKGRLDKGEFEDLRLNSPLPWDIVDTGISKSWLKADLQRALEKITVPDCSHSGLCSKCGVCDEEFGDNVVFDPPEIPKFSGHFVPNDERKQRIRMKYAKQGELIFIGHLDVIRLFERAFRRANIPLSFDSGFHSMPRISSAQPLPLGYSSSSELLDIELNEKMNINDFERSIKNQLPDDLQILEVEEIGVKKLNGKFNESSSKLLFAAEYILALQISNYGKILPESEKVKLFQNWIRKVNELQSFEISVETKSGNKRVMDLRKKMKKFEILNSNLPDSMRKSFSPNSNSNSNSNLYYVKFVGDLNIDTGNLRPEHIIMMMENVSNAKFELVHCHRSNLFLKPLSVPQIDMLRLRNIVKGEAFGAINRRYNGSSMFHDTQPTDLEDAQRNAQIASCAQ